MNTELPLPDAPAIEEMILGTILNDHEYESPLMEMIFANLTVEDFNKPSNRSLYRIMAELHEGNKPVGFATVVTHAQPTPGRVESFGGTTYLGSLVDATPRVIGSTLEAWISILRDKTMLRSVIHKTHEIGERAYASENPMDLIAEMQAIGDKIKSVNRKGEVFKLENVIDKIGVQEFFTPSDAPGIETPLSWLSERMRFTPKSLTVLAAKTSVGKSALATQILHEASTRRYRTVMISLEMSGHDLLLRIIGQQQRINIHRLRMNQADSTDRAAARQGLEELHAMDDLVLFNDGSAHTVPAITRILSDMALSRKPCKFLIVDYLQLMDPVGRFGSRAEEVASLSRGLKSISQRFNIPVLALSQLKRTDEREPMLSDLRESGSIEQDADNVIFLHRPNNKDEEVQDVRLILAKNRAGPCGKSDLLFTRRYVRFDQVGHEPEDKQGRLI